MIKVEKLDRFPANENPFWHDAYRMGERVGHNVMLMIENFPEDRCKYVILVNMETGERIKVSFDE